ncbi:MAG: T9SS type A sorting domain-containing protein [Saprospiraceae bacterium]
MKKRICTISLSFFILSIAIQSQTPDDKRGNFWLFGYTDGVFPPPPGFGVVKMDFNAPPLTVSDAQLNLSFSQTNASICDTDGDLLFFTNGIYIGKPNNEIMMNGDGLSPGIWTDAYAETGMIMAGGAVILPVPDSDSLYVVIHGKLQIYENPTLICMDKVYYSIVDMSLDNGEGAVTEKNVELVSDTLAVGDISVVRHGNGRDWWVMVPKYNSNIYYKILLTPDGFQELQAQGIDIPVKEGLGQSLFSPDGTRYARNELAGGIGVYDTVYVYDFDRCTGQLSNLIHFAYADSAFSGGVAFSPNSKLLHVPHYKHVFQFDLEAPDIFASMDTVATWDTFFSPFNTHFYLASLAPDGKIYMNAVNGVNVLHVINNPNEKGEACDIDQNGFQLPVYNATLPYLPNFRLGKWEGSPCDTIVLVSATAPAFPLPELTVYPNPASSFFVVNGQNVDFSLYDGTGRVVRRLPAINGESKINLSGLAQGIYFYKAEKNGRIVKNGKLIVERRD